MCVVIGKHCDKVCSGVNLCFGVCAVGVVVVVEELQRVEEPEEGKHKNKPHTNSSIPSPDLI